MANPIYWPSDDLNAARADAAQQSLSEKLAAFGRQYAQQQQQPQPVQQPALPSLTLDRNAFMPWLEDTAKTAVNTVSQGVQQATSALPSLDDVSAWMPWREKPQPAPSRADTTPSATGVAQTRPAAFGGTPQPMPQVSAQGQGEPLGTIAEGDPEQFFATAGPYARRVERDTGIPAALILAVAANETGYGQKRYMAGANNYFGIQAQPGEAGAVPYKDWRPGPGGGQVFYDAAQRSFADPLAGFYGFASFLKDNPRYAQALQQYQQTGNVEQLARDVHAAGYAEDPQWSNKLISIMRGIPTATGVGEVTDTRGVGLARPQPASGTPQAMPSASGDDLTPDQAALDDPDKWSLCGPVAAVAMARARGGNWTVAQAKAYAQQNGLWNAKQGMGGLQAEAKLLNGMGVAASARGVDWNAITQDVRGGNPVTLSTTFIDGGHYVVLEAYDPATGKFKVGGLGNVLKKTTGRGQWYTIGELNDLGGIQGALHFDNPASPTPSVAATAPTAGVPSAPADSPPTAPATPSPTQAGVAGVAPDINGAPGGTHAMLASGAAGEDQPPPPPQVYTRDQLQPDPAMAGVNGRTLIQGVAPDLAQGTGQQRAMAFPEQTPPTSSYNDPTDGGTQTQPLPVPVQPSYNDPTAGGTQSQPLPVPQPQLASGAAGEDTPSVPIPQATVADPTIQNPAYTQSSGTYYDPNDPTTWVNPDELGTLRPTDLPPALQGARPWNPPVAPPQGPIRVAPHVLDQIVPRAQQTAARPVESQPSELNPNSGTPQTAPYAPPTPEQQQIVATHIPQPGPPRIAPRTPNAHGDVEDSQPYPSDQQILQQQGPAAQAIDTLDRTLRSPEVQQAAATLAQLPTAPGNPITPIASLVRDYGRGSAQPLVAPSEDDRRAFMTGHQGTPSGLLDWHERMTVGAADALARGLGQDPARVVVGVRIGGVPVQMTVSDLLQNVTDPAFGAGFSVGDMVLDAVGQKALHLAAPYIKGAARGVVNALMQAAPPLQQGASAVGRGARALGEEAAGRLLDMTPTPSMVQRGTGGVAPESRRMYHGTAGDFARPDPARFDPNGLFGPGYYLTSDARVASSYATERAPRLRDWLKYQQEERDILNELEYATPNGDWARELQQRLSETRDAIRRVEPNASGSNVRAVDVPSGLNLLEADAPVPAEVLQRAERAVANLNPQSASDFKASLEGSVRQGRKWVASGEYQPDVPGERFYEVLDRVIKGHFGRTGSSKDVFESKRLTNEILASLGYDGLGHMGGRNSPLFDDAGKPISHTVNVIFGDSLDKIRNAFSGEVGGATLGAVPNRGGTFAARALTDASNSIGGGVFGAAAGYAAPADSEEERWRHGLIGAGLGMVGGPLAGRAMRRGEGALATFGAGANRAGRNAEHVYSPTAPAGFDRRYHGTAGAFDRPDVGKFDENALYGPGYYTTSDPRVASSYANARNYTPGGITPKPELIARRLTDELEQAQRDIRTLAPGDPYRETLEQRIRDIPGEIDRVTSQGPNVRAIDVPHDLNMIDADAPLDPNLIPGLKNLIDRIPPQYQEVADELRQAVDDVERRAATSEFGTTNDNVITELMDAGQRAMEWKPGGSGRGIMTAMLQRLGYDGITHTGGQRVPMLDSAGNPIEHNVSIIFPDSLDKVKNAFSGTKGGAFLPFDPASAALGAGAGADQDENGDPTVDPLKASAGMFLAGIGGTPQGRRAAQRALQRARNAAPPNLLEIAQHIRMGPGMLGNIGTGLLNALGGPVGIGAGLSSEAIRTGVMKGYPLPVLYQAAEMAKGAGQGVRDALGTALGFIPQHIRNAPDYRPPLAERMQGAVGKTIGYAIDTPGRLAVQTPDALFNPIFEAGGRARAAGDIMRENGVGHLDLGGQMQEMRRLLTNPTADEAARLDEAAKAYADEMTYRGKPGYWEETFGRMFRPGNRTATADDPVSAQIHDAVGSFLMPFYGGIWKINKLGTSYVPGLGFLTNRSLPTDEKIARQTVGLLFGMYVADRAAQGLVTGPGPDDPNEKARLRAKGWDDWATYVPGVGYVKSDNFAQAAPILKGIGAYYDNQRYGKEPVTDKDALKQGDAMVRRLMGTAASLPPVQAFKKLYDLTQTPIETATDLGVSAASSFVPSIVRARMASEDPYQRQVDRQAGGMEQARQKAVLAIGSVPYLGSRQDLAPAVDRRGEPISNPRAGVGAYLPRATQTEDEDPLLAEMAKNGVNLDQAKEQMSITVRNRPLGSVQMSLPWQQEWLRARWAALQQAQSDVLADRSYQQGDAATRKKLWETAVAKAETTADNAIKARHQGEIEQMLAGKKAS